MTSKTLRIVAVCLGIVLATALCRHRSGKKFSEPRIHAFVYEPTTGEARKLPVDFKSYLRELRSIYDLYKIDTKPIDIIEEERGFATDGEAS